MSMLVNPFILGASTPTTYKATVTIASATVASDLTDFPVMVRLSAMPSGFWSHVRSNGGDIRVKTTGGTLIPFDLARFDYTDQDGVLFFKAASVPTGSSSSWDIHYGNPANDRLAYSDTNGRNNVWSDYDEVFLLGETADDRKGGATINVNGDPFFFQNTSTSGHVTGVQGICFDGTYYYSVGTTAIYKYDSSFSLVSSNTNALSDCGISGANHIGDGEVKDGVLYVPVENYTDPTTFSSQHICRFDTSTLAFISKTNISAQAHECSSITYCDRDGYLYIASFGDHTKLWRYTTAGSYVSALTITYAVTPGANLQIQGVTWWHEAFWLHADVADEVFRLEFGGNCAISGLFGFPTTEIEGIGHNGDRIIGLDYDGVAGTVRTWKAYDFAKSAGGGVLFDSAGTAYLEASGRSSRTTYTLGGTVSWHEKSFNRTAISYWNLASGGTNTRQVIAFRSATPSLAIWDVNNSWLEPSPAINPTIDQLYRIHAVYQGTTNRKIYVDGVLKNTQTGISAVPSNLDTIVIGREDTDDSEPHYGNVGFVYLRPSVLSADWIAAEYLNVNAPGSFYTIGSETVV